MARAHPAQVGTTEDGLELFTLIVSRLSGTGLDDRSTMAIAGFRIPAAMSSIQDSAAEATMLTRFLPSDEPWISDHANHLRRAALEGAAAGGMHDVG